MSGLRIRVSGLSPVLLSTLLLLLSVTDLLTAQTVGHGPRYALVIGNGNYAELGKLRNPVNDATDMAKALGELGFQVKLLPDADLASMEDAVIRLGNQLAQSADSTGFFFYAGHGVQSGGINYLIPADARIASETFLKTKALAAQSVLDTLQQSRNALNVVVLDACRDNPFSWSRSGARGLSVVGSQPTGSIIAYATSAGSVAQDGTGRNGVFTQELLKHIRTPGLEIKDVLNRTGKAVGSVTSGKQVPAIYNQFFDSAYLAGASPAASTLAASPLKTPSFGTASAATGNLSIQLATSGTVSVAGLTAAVPAGTVPVNDLPAGSQTISVRYIDGTSESRTVSIPAGGTASMAFTYTPPVPAPTPAAAQTTGAGTATAKADTQASGRTYRNEVWVDGGSFQMGSTSGDSDEKPVHTVTVSGFWMMNTEVTQKDYAALIRKRPSYFKGDKLPVEQVNWYEAVTYANKLSERDRLTPVYRINETRVEWDRNADGWRLPTEAEWEFAAKGGSNAASLPYKEVYEGSKNPDAVAWYSGNSKKKTYPVATKEPNALGLYDMAGNVWEWTNDWYGSYGSEGLSDPIGAVSGINRVRRGGSWGDDALGIRSTIRLSGSPNARFYNIGFRLVRRP